MWFIDVLLDSTPIIGTVKSAYHKMTGDSEKAEKAFMKSTRATVVITAGTLGAFLGPAGVVAGSMYAGVALDTTESLIRKEPKGYLKHTEDLAKDIKRGKFPLKSSIRYGLHMGLDAGTGLGIHGVSRSIGRSYSQMGYAVGNQVLNKSVHMGRKGVCKKVKKGAIKNTISYYAREDSDSDDDY